MTAVDIVIVNYRSAAHTFKCVESVHRVAGADGIATKIFVVNNGDDPGTLELGLAGAGGATLIQNVSNLGFGVACNAGANRGTAPLVLFLNPDARLEPGALAACAVFLAAPTNASVGIVGPELHDGDGALVLSCSRLPTACDLILRTMGAHRILENSDYPYLSRAMHGHGGEVGQVMGAAMMVRRSLFDALGGFDPRFFLYYEDVDFAARAKAHGAISYYLKEAKAVHFGRASSSQDSGMALALHVRSRLAYARKHFGLLLSTVLLVVCVLVEFPLRLGQGLFGGGGKAASVLRAYRALVLQQSP